MNSANYTLTITTAIRADGYDDSMEVAYPCDYSCEDGTHRLKYDDADNGFTVVKVMPDGEIQIRRRNTSSIIMRSGYSHHIDYETPYGSIPMTFTLHDADCTLSAGGGRLAYVAEVLIDGEPQTNSVTMELFLNERTDSIQ